MEVSDRYKELSKEISDWIVTTQGAWFTNEKVDRQFDIKTRVGKSNRWHILENQVKGGALQKHPRRSGEYRYVYTELEPIEYKGIDLNAQFPIKFPLEIEKYVRILPKTLTVLAGDVNKGKSAFLLNIVHLNQGKGMPIHYFSNEMGAQMLGLRVANFNDGDWDWSPWERFDDYEDVIQPDAINIIDYLSITDNFFLVGEKLDRIFQKLNRGIAIVAIQKNVGSELGLGRERGLERPTLYMAMEYQKLIVRKAKLFANPKLNPNGLIFKYKLVNGTTFIPDGEPMYG